MGYPDRPLVHVMMPNKPYTCSSYRQEMILAGLRKRLAEENLTARERKVLLEQIRKVEQEMGLD